MTKKRVFWFAVIIIGLIFAGSAFSMSRALGTKAQPVAANGCFIGVFREGAPATMAFIKKFEKEAGRKPAMIMWYQDWAQSFPRSACDNARLYGAVPQIVWEPWYWGEMERIKLDNITNGEWDEYIRSWAKDIKAYGYPVFLRVGHEFNIEGYPWGVINNGKDPKKYIAAYRRVVDIFKKEGTKNVKWIWCFMNFSFPDEPWNDYEAAYPGDDYVDWIGIDGYNWGTTQSWSDWQTFKFLFRDQARRMMKLHPTKPIMVAEFGCAEKGGDKAAWIKSMPFDLKSSMKNIKSINWFDIRKETDWRITSSEKSLAAFKAIMKDPFFLSSGELFNGITVAPGDGMVKAAKAVKARSPIKIDGSLSDFSDGLPIVMDKKENLQEGTEWAGPKDLSGAVIVKWDNEYLYVAVKVTDITPMTNKKRRGDIWNGDGIEITISTDPGADPNREDVSDRDFQIGFGTGDGRQNKPSVWIWQKRSQPEGSEIAVKKTATGYNLEAKVPWRSFTDWTPRAKDVVGFDVALDDANSDERVTQLIWNGDYAFYRDPSVWGRLQFIEQ